MCTTRSTLVPRLAPLLALFALSACSVVGFEVDVPLQESRVMGSPLGGLLGGLFDLPIPLEVDLAAETAARDTGPASAVRLADLRLTITDTDEPAGDTDDFAFVERVELFVESAQAGSTLPRQRIGEATRPAAGARVLVFDVDASINLLPYINEGARLTSSGAGEVPPDDVSFDGSATLSIEVL